MSELLPASDSSKRKREEDSGGVVEATERAPKTARVSGTEDAGEAASSAGQGEATPSGPWQVDGDHQGGAQEGTRGVSVVVPAATGRTLSAEEEEAMMSLRVSPVSPGGARNPNLRVDGLLTHYVDTMAMYLCSDTLANRFTGLGITKVVSVATAGICVGFCLAICLNVDFVYARKKPFRAPNIITSAYRRKGRPGKGSLFISGDFLEADDVVLLADSFLATGHTICSLADLVRRSGARVGGVAVLIEKVYKRGRETLQNENLGAIESIVRLLSMDADSQTFSFDESSKDCAAGTLLCDRISERGIITPAWSVEDSLNNASRQLAAELGHDATQSTATTTTTAHAASQ